MAKGPQGRSSVNGGKQINAVQYKDKHKNIPTEKLRDLVWDKASKAATARNLWIPAVNNAATWGRWAFIEIADPWDAKNTISTYIRKRGINE